MKAIICSSVVRFYGGASVLASRFVSSLAPPKSCWRLFPFISLVAFVFPAHADFTIATDGKPCCVIIQQADATVPEQNALKELNLHLEQITGGQFEVRTNVLEIPKGAIIVGQGTIAAKVFSEIDFAKLGAEELVMRVKDGKLLLAGGRPRGTIYAVDRFLQEQCGVRWWTPWATNIPHRATLRVANLNVHEKPAFEYRGPYWFAGFDPVWKVRNGANGESSEIPTALGGCVKYKGYCHTFYPLVPPEKFFTEHPDWYSMINGKRTHEKSQLCLTNPKLRDFMVQRVKEWLRECPDCEIISVTQNDWAGWCECPDCKALDDVEESHAGTMIAFANYIAEKIEAEFPHVAVDTFAYQYTRKPPKNIKPRSNVIVRLCSIECNFREPLDAPVNASFASDIKKWSEICQRLYVWDYVTDFSHYVHPHPNWFVLGANMKFFQEHNVKGVFEEGAYAGHGAEMAELRVWVLAQLLWNPQQDDKKLIREFLDGYYGKAAAKPIYKYMELIHAASKDFFLGCYLRKDPPSYLDFKTLNEAELLWQQAEAAAEKDSDPEKILRVRIAHLPVRYAFLKDWITLRLDCWEQNLKWPLNESRKLVAAEFKKVCDGVPGKDWTQLRVMSERGLLVETFLANFTNDPPLTKVQTPAPPRLKNPKSPADLKLGASEKFVDLQDNLAGLYKRGEFADILPDENASDHRAVWMPGDHAEWAFRISGERVFQKAKTGKWKIYAVVRVEKNPDAKTDSIAFAAGVYDAVVKNYPADAKFRVSETDNDYHSYLVGTFEPSAARDIFVSPANNPGVKAIWVDRIFLVSDPAKN